MPFAAVWLWTTQLAMIIDAWRAAQGPAIGGWLNAVGEFKLFSAPGQLLRGKPGRPVSGDLDRSGTIRRRGPRPSAHRHRTMRTQRCQSGRSGAGSRGQRLKYVGQKYTLALGRCGGCDGPGRRRCGPRCCGSLRWPSGRPSAFRIHFKPASLGSMQRSPVFDSSSTCPAVRCRSFFSSTSSSTAPTLTTAAPEPSLFFEACSTAARSA